MNHSCEGVRAGEPPGADAHRRCVLAAREKEKGRL